MKKIYFILFFPFCLCAQEFPSGWIGLYKGEMKITSGRNKNSVPVTLEIGEKIKDSVWTYKMTYKSPNEEVVKDYQIIKKNENEYVMDEGAIKIGMKYVDNTFFDYYQLDSMYFTSTLRKIDSKTLSFDIYGGSLKEKDKVTTNEDSFFVHSYVPTFVQSVRLKRKKK